MLDNILGINSKVELTMDEAIKAFVGKRHDISDKQAKAVAGEGLEMLPTGNSSFKVGLSTFNGFYNSYLNQTHSNEVAKIRFYRNMADMPEIADVIEDATNETTQENNDGNVIELEIDEELAKNENIKKIIYNEFESLFFKRININEKLWDLIRTYYIDGRVYYERIINTNKGKEGVINIKRLPSESMDFDYDPETNRIESWYQYIVVSDNRTARRPQTREEAEKDKNIIVFEPAQIGAVDYGIYGRTKHEIFGFLEKAKVPYNQLKLLETSVIIYRMVRSPERLLFKIDVGNMPKDKALKFVEKVKTRFLKKQTYDPSTGTLTNEPNVMCIRKDTEIPLLDGRHLTLKKIVEEHNMGKENWVYSINQKTHNIEPGKIIDAKITRLNEQLVRTWFDNGKYIDTTPDHKFILRDGSECRADMLEKGQSLMPLYRRTRKINYQTTDYMQHFNLKSEKWEFDHRKFGSLPKKGYAIHHKDFNRFNNNPQNLQSILYKDHLQLHRNNIKNLWKENYEKMHDAVIRGRKTLKNNPDKFNAMKEKVKSKWIDNRDQNLNSIRNGIKKWHSNPDNMKKHSEWTIRTNIEQNKVKKMIKVLNIPEVRARQKEAVRKNKTEWFANEENRAKFSQKKSVIFDEESLDIMCNVFLKYGRPSRDKLTSLLTEDEYFINHLKNINRNQSISNRKFKGIHKRMIWKMIKMLGFSDYPDFRQNYVFNHKIEKVEILNERDDTGCIEVEGNHNFAVSQNRQSLVFIKNSILENFFVPVCLRLNTKISLLSGKEKSLSEIIEDYNKGIKHEVYSVSQKDGKIKSGKIEWAGLTRKNAKLVRVWLDNGEYVDCTPDHKFVMRNGEEVQAQNLSPNDSIMPLYRRKEKINPKSNEYTQHFDLKNNEWKFDHREFGPMQKKGYAIHHKDFNRFNNSSNNLISMLIKEHIKLHYMSNKERKSYIPLQNALNKPENREKQRNAARQSMVNRFKNNDNRKKMGELFRKRWQDPQTRKILLENIKNQAQKSEETKKKISESIKNKWKNDPEYRERGVKSLRERWLDPSFKEKRRKINYESSKKLFASERGNEIRKKISKAMSVRINDKIAELFLYICIQNKFPHRKELLKYLQKNEEFIKEWHNLNKDVIHVKTKELSKHIITHITKFYGFNNYTEFQDNVTINHKVVKVEWLPFKEDTGCITIENPGNDHNFALSAGVFVKNSSDGRGSDVETVGGDSKGFTELDDIYYFARKLYRALKYPLSRISAAQEGREADILVGGSRASEISRDEIKWAKFLERTQNKFCREFKDLFLLHLEFKGIKTQYNLDESKLQIIMSPPSHYNEAMEQQFLEQKFSNYSSLSNNPEFSKYFLMKKYLELTDDDIKDNIDGFKEDEKIPKEERGY